MPEKYKKLPKSKPGWISKLMRDVNMLIRGKNYYRDKTRLSFGERISMTGRMKQAGIPEERIKKYRGKDK